MPARDRNSGARNLGHEDSGRRSLWFAAVWTGVGAAVVCATLAIVVVAICWLPVSGASGHSLSALHAGLLTYLSALHGGITVDGTPAQFVPVGMTIVVALAAWRAGAGLAAAAADLDESDPARLGVAGALQAASFTVASLIAVPFAHLGTSSAPVLGVGAAALVLFTAVGGASLVRSSGVADRVLASAPQFATAGMRAAAVATAVYLGAGAVLAGGSLGWHASRVLDLSRQVGGGWGGVPVLILGLFAVPNAVIAGSSYLAGPGFSVGAGTSVNAVTTTHGVLPAFPILGAVPSGHGATWYVWVLAGATLVAAGAGVARVALRADGWRARGLTLGGATVVVAVIWTVLAWQGGGGIGAGRLAVVGASPWQVGGTIGAQVLVLGSVGLGLAAAWQAVRGQRGAHPGALEAVLEVVQDAAPDLEVVAEPAPDGEAPPAPDGQAPPAPDSDRAGKLAG